MQSCTVSPRGRAAQVKGMTYVLLAQSNLLEAERTVQPHDICMWTMKVDIALGSCRASLFRKEVHTDLFFHTSVISVFFFKKFFLAQSSGSPKILKIHTKMVLYKAMLLVDSAYVKFNISCHKGIFP